MDDALGVSGGERSSNLRAELTGFLDAKFSAFDSCSDRVSVAEFHH